MNFIDLLRMPDDVRVQTAKSPIRFEEPICYGGCDASDSRVVCEIGENTLRVILMPDGEPVKWIRLRFDGEISQENDTVINVLGDGVERMADSEGNWQSIHANVRLPWYFHIYNGRRLDSYGVRTGGNAFAFWQCDDYGITVWLDVRNGSDGVQNKEPLLCAELVCRKGSDGENAYLAAQSFCKMMCPKPNLPKTPVYGFNNWYWAYGGIDRKTVLREAASLSVLAEGCQAKPFMVIDDGWQISHAKGYNGGAWNACNERFCKSNLTDTVPNNRESLLQSADGMAETAAEIKERGCRAGIWFRPLLTMTHTPADAIYKCPSVTVGTVLDPSHPFTLEKVAEDVSGIASWGYELIKHDFTTYDIYGRTVVNAAPMYDKTKTNAQIFKNLYQTIQKAAGDTMILGCNVIGHLSAGIHEAQRVGDDTSGRSFEWTRRNGIHSMIRLPQNNTFFSVDPDCAAFTARVPKDLNFDFLEAAAISGCAVFASVTPDILTADEEKRLNAILKIAADVGTAAIPTDWTRTNSPSSYIYKGIPYRYNWYQYHHGSRSVLTWLE